MTEAQIALAKKLIKKYGPQVRGDLDYYEDKIFRERNDWIWSKTDSQRAAGR